MAVDDQSQSEEKVFIVFGGTGGIGSAVSRRLVSSGAKVVVTGRNQTILDQSRSDIGVETQLLDIAQPDGIDSCVSQTFERHGHVDGIVNCIGSLLLKPAHLITDQEWQSVIDVNLTSSFKTVP